VHRAVRAALSINPMLALMQCNTNYTASLENFKYIQLNVLKTYRMMYPDLVLGLSDHTPGHATVLGAVTLGARMVEKHFTDDIQKTGPDHAFSMDPSSWREMVERTRELEAALGTGVKEVEDNEIDTVIVQRRSLRAKTTLPKGHLISADDFVPLRPCPRDAMQPYEIEKAIGKSLNREIGEGEYLKTGDV
jgi:sialic acid synthase SpsE